MLPITCLFFTHGLFHGFTLSSNAATWLVVGFARGTSDLCLFTGPLQANHLEIFKFQCCTELLSLDLLNIKHFPTLISLCVHLFLDEL